MTDNKIDKKIEISESTKQDKLIEKIKKNNPKLFDKIIKKNNSIDKNIKADPPFSDPITISINQYGVAITPNEQYLYIVNNKYYGINPPYYNSESVLISYDMVYLYDLINENMVAEINHHSFNTPSTVVISNGFVYVTNADSTTISVIDMATNKVSGIIDGFNRPYRIVINNSENIGYVCNYGDGETNGTVSVVNLNTYTIIKNIEVGYGPCNCALSIDNKRLCVTNYGFDTLSPTISIINTSSLIVIKTIESYYGLPFNIYVDDNNIAGILNIINFSSVYITTLILFNLNTLELLNDSPYTAIGVFYGIILSTIPNFINAYILFYETNLLTKYININEGIPSCVLAQFDDFGVQTFNSSEFNIKICPAVGNAILTYDKKFLYVSNYSTRYRNINNLVKL